MLLDILMVKHVVVCSCLVYMMRVIVLWLYTFMCFFFLMIRRPPRSTQSRSSAASDVYKRQLLRGVRACLLLGTVALDRVPAVGVWWHGSGTHLRLSLIHISEPTRLLSISYAVFCLKKKNENHNTKRSVYHSNRKRDNH